MPISGTFALGEETTFNDCVVEVDLTPASSSWANITTWSTQVRSTGFETPMAETNTFGLNSAVIFPGKNGSGEVAVSLLYTENAATDPFINIWAAHVAAGAKKMDVRWVPQGTATTNYRFVTNGGRIMSCTQPGGEASVVNPLTFTFVIKAASLTQETNT